jgi:hypothetical protein
VEVVVAWVVDRRRRVWIDPADGAVTVAEWVARWFRSLDLDPRTIESYRSRWGRSRCWV